MRGRSAIAGAVVLSLPLAGSFAEAQVVPRPRANLIELFARLDANGDRLLDRTEIPADGLDAFETLLRHGDTDRNGQLEGEEFRSLLEKIRTLAPRPDPAREAAFFRSRDRDSDGVLDRDEFPGPSPLFDRLDSDEDGTLSPGEFTRARTAPDRGRRIEPPRPAPSPSPASDPTPERRSDA